MYIQPMSNSYHFDESLAELAKAWWLLCSSSPPIRMPQGDDVGARVRAVPVAIPPPVTEAVDDAGREDRDPEHLDREHGDADHAEQHHVDDQRQVHADDREARVQIALDPVVRACRGRTSPASRGCAIPRDRARSPRAAPCFSPRVCGLCGSSSVSHLAWCLRWIAAHSRVTMPVVSQSQKRKKCETTGCRSSARCAWQRCR